MVGERVALISYRPSAVGGPYAEVGPVFVHADGCSGYTRTAEYPAAFRDRRQLFRAYSVEGAQVDNRLVDPHEIDTVLADLLSRPEIAYIHSRNPLAGCYMFSVSMASSPTAVSRPATRPGGKRWPVRRAATACRGDAGPPAGSAVGGEGGTAMSARETDADQNANDVDAPVAGTFGGEATGAQTLGQRFADDDTDTADTPGDDAAASGADPESTSSS